MIIFVPSQLIHENCDYIASEFQTKYLFLATAVKKRLALTKKILC